MSDGIDKGTIFAVAMKMMIADVPADHESSVDEPTYMLTANQADNSSLFKNKEAEPLVIKTEDIYPLEVSFQDMQ